MRISLMICLVFSVSLRAFAQPVPLVDAEELRKAGSHVKLEVTGRLELHPRNPIDIDPQVLLDYQKEPGAWIRSAAAGSSAYFFFYLYLGENRDFPDTAKELNGKPALIEGDLVVVHSPAQFSYFGGATSTLGPDTSSRCGVCFQLPRRSPMSSKKPRLS